MKRLFNVFIVSYILYNIMGLYHLKLIKESSARMAHNIFLLMLLYLLKYFVEEGCGE